MMPNKLDGKSTASRPRFGLWMAEAPAGVAWLSSLLYPTDLRLNCQKTVSGLRREPGLSARGIWASLFWKAATSRPVSLTSGRRVGRWITSGQGASCRRQRKGKGRACCRGNSAAPPHPHPALVQNRSCSSLLLFIFNSQGMD